MSEEENLAFEINAVLKRLSKEEKIDVPEWKWHNGLLVFSNVKNNVILIDQIYNHVWEAEEVKSLILSLLEYEITFVFYYLLKGIEPDWTREFSPSVPGIDWNPPDKDAEHFTWLTTDMSVSDYNLAAMDLFSYLATRDKEKKSLIEMLLH